MKVLVVDDEKIARDMVCMALRKSGYEVLMAEDGAKALHILEEDNCQLVVCDWQMPEMNGIEFCRAVRERDFGRYIYIIMLTANNRPQDVLDGLNAGADDFVSKPFNPPEIAVRIRSASRLITLESAEMTIFAMAKLAESRDPETGAHLERVQRYCRTLAEQLRTMLSGDVKIDPEYIRLIYQTSPLHDIGKVAVPDCVLLKAGRLSDDEFDLMKTHTLAGAATLEAAMSRYPNARFLSMARDIALYHHEKYDGSGYPHGLSGESIPLCARIVALADVYDALTSKRVYKDAFTHNVARSIIVDDSGKHFDPKVVEAFVACEQSFIDIRRSLSDIQVDAA